MSVNLKKSVMLFSGIEHKPRGQSFGTSNTRINHLFTKRNLKSIRSNKSNEAGMQY